MQTQSNSTSTKHTQGLELHEIARENSEANPKSRIHKDHLRSAAGLLRKLQSHQLLAFIGCSLNEWCHSKLLALKMLNLKAINSGRDKCVQDKIFS